MSCLFDALFFPIAFFKKKECGYGQSFFAFIAVISVNLLADFRFLERLFSFFSFTALLFLLLIPIVVSLMLFGLDLLLIKSDRNHWVKTHVAFTYVPYFFLPLIMPLVHRSVWPYQLFGWLIVLLICLWSYTLFDLLFKNYRYTFIRFFRDISIIVLWTLL
ncbi:MAG TPA: hypothetical protein P5107_03830 [Thermotogota bacterium]|nr:hypothetical protein [Thermotogota bacterium]